MKRIALLSACLVPFAAKAAEKPNVIIILADDLGYGDLQCYGARNVLTPNVDRLACEGVRFTDAHAVASTSTPSRYSLLTGMYSWRRSDTDVARGDAGEKDNLAGKHRVVLRKLQKVLESL